MYIDRELLPQTITLQPITNVRNCCVVVVVSLRPKIIEKWGPV